MGIGAIALGAVVVGALAFSAISPLTASAKADDKVFSHNFKNAAPCEVLAWMKQEGIKIDVDQALIPDRLLTMVFDGANRDGVVNSFARTIGFQSEKRGDVYSLLKGTDAVPYGEGSFDEDQDPAIAVEGFELAMIQEPDTDGILEEVMSVLEEAGVSPSQMKKIKARLKERLAKRHEMPMRFKMGDFPRIAEGVEIPRIVEGMEIPEIAMDIEGMEIPEIAMDIEGMELPLMGNLEIEMDEDSMGQDGVMKALMQAREAIDRAMAQLHGKGMHAPNMKDRMRLHGMQGEEIKKHMAELEKQFGEGKNFRFHGMDEEEMAELEKHFGKHGEFEFKFDEKAMQEHMKEMEKHFGEKGEFKFNMEKFDKNFGEGMKVLKFKMENLKKFIKSLTKEQKALADKQGFLRIEDLTKDQRALLDLEEGKDVDLNFNVDGDSIRIKSGKGESKKVALGIGA